MDVREKLVELVHDARMNALWHNAQKPDEYIADFLVEDGVTVQEWISVKDRLPKEDEDIIAFCYYHESWQAQVCHLSSNYEGQWYTSVAGQWVRVTHWMPLPETPKGE